MIKIISALFLISFLTMNSCLEISPMDNNLIPNKSSRAQLVEIMVEVQTEENPNTIGGFVGQLTAMLHKLVAAQNKHRHIHAKMMKQCIGEDKFRAKEIAAAKKALAASLAARTRCAASLKAAIKALPGLVSAHKTYSTELRRATIERRLENKRYIKRRDEFTEALAMLADFISYVHKKMGKTYKAWAFAELSENVLRHTAKLGVMVDAVPVLVTMASAKASNYKYVANQGLGSRLKKALDTLNNRLIADNKKNNVDEANALRVYLAYATKLRKMIKTLAKNIARVKKQIIDMTRCVDEETLIMASAAKKNARNSKLRNNARKMCQAFNNEFIEATYNRLDEIKTMGEILKIVAKRFKSLPKDLVSYLEKTKDGWIKYTNSTKFKKFKEYKRKVYAVNKRGALLSQKNGTKKIAFFF
jgi:hypothetical protein